MLEQKPVADVDDRGCSYLVFELAVPPIEGVYT